MFREYTNDDRAARAQEAVDTFKRATGTDDEDAISDLLCNLMHLCDVRGDDFGTLLNRGAGHYQAEIEIAAKQDAGEDCDPSAVADDPHHYVKTPGLSLPTKVEEWSGSPCPDDPDNFWIDDATGERRPA